MEEVVQAIDVLLGERTEEHAAAVAKSGLQRITLRQGMPPR
jgi:hypothetical protein